MALTLKVEFGRRATYLIAPKDMKPNPEYNGRFVKPTKEDQDNLLADIVANGQTLPILFKSDGGWPVVVDGNRRWEVVMKGIEKGVLPPEFRLECVPFDGDEQEAFLAAVRANRHRTERNAVDDAHNIAKMRRFGMEDAQIAATFGEDAEWVKKTVVYVGLTKEGAMALAAGKLKAPAARNLAKLSADVQREKLKGDKPLTAAALREPSDKPARPTVKGLRAVLEEAANDTTEHKHVRAFADKLLAIIDGKSAKEADAGQAA